MGINHHLIAFGGGTLKRLCQQGNRGGGSVGGACRFPFTGGGPFQFGDLGARSFAVFHRVAQGALNDFDAGLKLAAARLGLQQLGLHDRNLLQRGVKPFLRGDGLFRAPIALR